MIALKEEAVRGGHSTLYCISLRADLDKHRVSVTFKLEQAFMYIFSNAFASSRLITSMLLTNSRSIVKGSLSLFCTIEAWSNCSCL